MPPPTRINRETDSFPRIEHFDAIGVQKLHELVQVRSLLREFVCRLFQRLGVDDLDCRIVRIDE